MSGQHLWHRPCAGPAVQTGQGNRLYFFEPALACVYLVLVLTAAALIAAG